MRIPKSFNDISLKQYINFIRVDNSKLDMFDKIITKLSILTGENYESVANIPIVELTKINKQFEWASKEVPTAKLKNEFKINGTTYEIITDANKLTAGQYTSVMTKLKGVEPIEIIHEVLASISTIKGVKVKDLPVNYYSDTAELFLNNLTVIDAYSIGVFFCKVSNELTEVIQDFLSIKTKKIQGEVEMLERDLQISGGGLQQ